MTEKYIITVTKDLSPHVRRIPTYILKTLSVNGVLFDEVSDPLATSQVSLHNLAYCFRDNLMRLGAIKGLLVVYEVRFPQEISFFTRGQYAFSKEFGLTEQEIDDFFVDVNNQQIDFFKD